MKFTEITEITITLSPQELFALAEMHASGMFGLTLSGVVEEMVRAAVRDAILKGWATPPKGLYVEEGRLMLVVDKKSKAR